ncbi:hypothetical protein [Salidesulfovibrio onnuriiensis]|uniref:hypothetical protein n=1 Tax=Salidesulfovibrio onnuriiensis TaxID=2583823 RepID=UPI0011CCC896|nr:hypothetical protein [Salidesulfovibrio onnuriiensis]
MNTLWFCFPQETRRKLHGTPTDVQRKFRALDKKGMVSQGMEMYLMPSRLAHDPGFTIEFINRFSQLDFRTIHIGETDPDFLDTPETAGDLARLADIVAMLKSPAVLLHAHHLRDNRAQRADLLRNSLPGTEILIENNGFDNEWGARPENVWTILQECPDFNLCMDIVHIKDFADIRLKDFTKPPILERIREIHWSCSTYLMKGDPYESRGYQGYNPFHALFPLTDITPSDSTLEFIRQYPVVMEGVVPPEDSEYLFLSQELEIILNGVPK